MWEWILKTLNGICRSKEISELANKNMSSSDDVVSDVCLQLLENPEYAKEIYEGEKVWLLYKLAKAQLYTQSSKLQFDNKTDFFKYSRIIELCERYNIEPIPQNAYKIAAFFSERDYGIARIKRILSVRKESLWMTGEADVNLFQRKG